MSVQDNALLKAQGDSKSNLQVLYFGFGIAFGVTRINSGGHYTRLPYLFTPTWNAKQWAFVLVFEFCLRGYVCPGNPYNRPDRTARKS